MKRKSGEVKTECTFRYYSSKALEQGLPKQSLRKAREQLSIYLSQDTTGVYLMTPYLLRALSISMTTKTERAIVIGAGWSNTSQSTPRKRSSCARHWEWWVYTMGDDMVNFWVFKFFTLLELTVDRVLTKVCSDIHNSTDHYG